MFYSLKPQMTEFEKDLNFNLVRPSKIDKSCKRQILQMTNKLTCKKIKLKFVSI